MQTQKIKGFTEHEGKLVMNIPEKRFVIRKSKDFKIDNTFFFKIYEGRYSSELEVYGERNARHDRAVLVSLGYCDDTEYSDETGANINPSN